MAFIEKQGSVGTLATYAHTVPFHPQDTLADGLLRRAAASSFAVAQQPKASPMARAEIISMVRAVIINAATESEHFDELFYSLAREDATKHFAISSLLLSWKYLDVEKRMQCLTTLEENGMIADAAIIARYMFAKQCVHGKNISLLESLIARAELTVQPVAIFYGGFGIGFPRRVNYDILNPDFLVNGIKKPLAEYETFTPQDASQAISSQLRCLEWLRFLGEHQRVVDSLAILKQSLIKFGCLCDNRHREIDRSGLQPNQRIDGTELILSLQLIQIESLLLMNKVRAALGSLDTLREVSIKRELYQP